MYEYKCKVVRVVDGDTVDVDIDLGFGVWLHKERVRIIGMDTPESRTRDKEEKKYGLAAKAELKVLLDDDDIKLVILPLNLPYLALIPIREYSLMLNYLQIFLQISQDS